MRDEFGHDYDALDRLLSGVRPVHQRSNIERRIIKQIEALNDLENRLYEELNRPSDLRPMIKANILMCVKQNAEAFRNRMLAALNPHEEPTENTRRWWEFWR